MCEQGEKEMNNLLIIGGAILLVILLSRWMQSGMNDKEKPNRDYYQDEDLKEYLEEGEK